MTKLQTILGVEHPLIQAPMAGAQGSALAIAVSSAGALGSLPCATLGEAAVRDEIAKVAKAERPFNVNFFCHAPPAPDPAGEDAWRTALAPYYAELGLDIGAVGAPPSRAPFTRAVADAIAEFEPPIVSFHFGLPSGDLLEMVRRWGARILSSATTVEEARWLEARGVDAIIAQGTEAGGHRGHFLSDDLTLQMGTFALVPQIVRAVGVPVIAAGGIVDDRGVAAAMALGAAGVQIGTAYLLCPEATISAVHREALRSDEASHTAITNVFSGRPARGIVNRLVREVGPMSALAPAFPLASVAVAPLRAKSESSASRDFAQMWSGQNARGCRAVPAAELTRALVEGLRRSSST